jgi:hypothetical protein
MTFLCISQYFFPSFPKSVLQTLFLWSLISAALASLTICFVTMLTLNQDVLFLFPIGVQVAYFLVIGLSYIVASRKDMRKPVSEPKLWKVWLLRIFVVLALLFYMLSFMTYILAPERERVKSKIIITILTIDLKLSDISYWGQLTALCKFISLLIDKEIEESKRRQFKIALICFLLVGLSSLTIIVLKLDYVIWILTLRVVEVSFMILCNVIFAIIAGFQREVFTPECAAECV